MLANPKNCEEPHTTSVCPTAPRRSCGLLWAPLEPALLLHRVLLVEFRVVLGQVDDPFHQANGRHHEGADAESEYRHTEHGQARFGKAEDELVDAERS